MPQPDKACVNEEELLFYAARALDEADRKRVSAHVSDCPRCRSLVKETEELAQIYRSTAPPAPAHPEPALLAAFAEGSFVGTAVRDHVQGCPECGEILSVVQRVNREIAAPAVLAPRGLGQGWAAFRSSPWLRAAPAYLVVLLLLYPAYRGTLGTSAIRERVQELETPRLLGTPYALATEGERGAAPVEIRLGENGQAVVTFFVPISSVRYHYEVELLGPAGDRRFFEPNARSFDGRGTFALLVPAGTLGRGSYELRVEEKEGQATTNTFLFRFRVQK